jgi:uncharacterized membrane protein YhiD involved in acid resistance
MDFLQFGQLALAAMVAYMVLKFLFKMVEKKFDEQQLQQQTLTKVIETDVNVDSIAKTIDKVSTSQEKIVESQSRLVVLIESVNGKINGR